MCISRPPRVFSRASEGDGSRLTACVPARRWGAVGVGAPCSILFLGVPWPRGGLRGDGARASRRGRNPIHHPALASKRQHGACLEAVIFGSRPAGYSRSRTNSRSIAAGRVRILARGGKKSLKRTRPYCGVPPFLMSDRLFRIEKIVAFGGGVKCNSQNPKRGGWGGP
jgi:hypothetical protein